MLLDIVRVTCVETALLKRPSRVDRVKVEYLLKNGLFAIVQFRHLLSDCSKLAL